MRALQQDPDATQMLGRQPEQFRLTPSKGLRWYYGSIVEGQRFTRQQHATLISRGLDPLTVPALTVKRQAQRIEVWFPTTIIPPRYEMECPILERMKDGRVRVIAPNGTLKLVQADGWAHRPYRLPDCYRLAAA